MPFKKTLITFLVLYLIMNLVYWQDPWLWRNYARFFATGTATEAPRPAGGAETTVGRDEDVGAAGARKHARAGIGAAA